MRVARWESNWKGWTGKIEEKKGKQSADACRKPYARQEGRGKEYPSIQGPTSRADGEHRDIRRLAYIRPGRYFFQISLAKRSSTMVVLLTDVCCRYLFCQWYYITAFDVGLCYHWIPVFRFISPWNHSNFLLLSLERNSFIPYALGKLEIRVSN